MVTQQNERVEIISLGHPQLIQIILNIDYFNVDNLNTEVQQNPDKCLICQLFFGLMAEDQINISIENKNSPLSLENQY
jgi:hypothetical protein